MGDGDLLGELEVSDLSDPFPLHSLLPDADPNLWRMLASFKLTEFMEEGVKEGWGDGGIGDSWGITKYFWAFSVVSLCWKNGVIFEFSRAFQWLIFCNNELCTNLILGDLGVLGDPPPRGLECEWNIFPAGNAGDSKPGDAADEVPVETEVEVELLLGLQLLSVPE